MRVRGTIANRVLLNYRLDPQVARDLLPCGLRPRIVRDSAIAGVCLIELASLRPSAMPRWSGLGMINAGYRIAVEWGDDPPRYGVYLHRRDTSSRLAAWLGGRLFPGVHQLARFETRWARDDVRVKITSRDPCANFLLEGTLCDAFHHDSVFADQEELSRFFHDADRGFSPGPHGTEGLRLTVKNWKVRGFQVRSLRAGFFDDRGRYPAGSLAFDSALFMSQVDHEWERTPAPIR